LRKPYKTANHFVSSTYVSVFALMEPIVNQWRRRVKIFVVMTGKVVFCTNVLTETVEIVCARTEQQRRAGAGPEETSKAKAAYLTDAAAEADE
jgi:hypothetical protein